MPVQIARLAQPRTVKARTRSWCTPFAWVPLRRRSDERGQDRRRGHRSPRWVDGIVTNLSLGVRAYARRRLGGGCCAAHWRRCAYAAARSRPGSAPPNQRGRTGTRPPTSWARSRSWGAENLVHSVDLLLRAGPRMSATIATHEALRLLYPIFDRAVLSVSARALPTQRRHHRLVTPGRCCAGIATWSDATGPGPTAHPGGHRSHRSASPDPAAGSREPNLGVSAHPREARPAWRQARAKHGGCSSTGQASTRRHAARA